MDQASSEFGVGGGGSDIFQFKKSGEYVIRLLTQPAPLGMHFFGKGQSSVVCIGMEKGCPFHGLTDAGKEGKIDPKTNEKEEFKKPTVKFMVYLIDRQTNKMQLGEMPWSVIKEVGDLELNPDWKFESYPMPYDLRIKVDKENQDPKQVYKVFTIPKIEAITDAEQEELMDKVTKIAPPDFVAKRKEKQKQKFVEDGTWAKFEEKRKKEVEEAQARTAATVGPKEDYPEGPGGVIPF